MDAVLLVRTGSVPALEALASPRITSSLSIHDRHGSADFNSSKFSSRLNFSDRRSKSKTIRRATSESDMRFISEATGRSWIGVGSGSARIEEEEWWAGSEAGVRIVEREGYEVEIGDFGENRVDEDLEAGGGIGKGKALGGGGGGEGFGGGDDDSDTDWSSKSKVDVYYKQMLKLNPVDPLLLRNYARFLYEVMKDTARADEYYGRAILANPGDGEVLGLYAKFIWETQKDCERAKCYFDQAVHASPENCMVMGMYAEFMWECEEDEEDDGMKLNEASLMSSAASLASITAY